MRCIVNTVDCHYLVIVGDNVRKLRKKCGLTQSQLAHLCFVSKNTISTIESGDGFPSLSLLVAFSKVFGVSLDELVETFCYARY